MPEKLKVVPWTL